MSLLLFCHDPTFRIWSECVFHEMISAVEMKLTQLQRFILKHEMSYPAKRIEMIDAKPWMRRGGMSWVDWGNLKDRVAKHKAQHAVARQVFARSGTATRRQRNRTLFAELDNRISDSRQTPTPTVYSQMPPVEKTKSAPQAPTAQAIALAKDFAESISKSERQRFGILAALLK